MKSIFLCLILTITLGVLIRPAYSMQRVTSVQGPLLDIPVKEFSFTNLSLSEVLEALCVKSGFLYGIVISEDDPSLIMKRSAKVGRSTLKGVLNKISEVYPEYQFMYYPRAVVVIPKKVQGNEFNWLSNKKVKYAFSNIVPYNALMSLLTLDDIVKASNDQLPASLPPHKTPQPQIDSDGDILLMSGEYSDALVVDIINDIAFRCGQCWAIHFHDAITTINGKSVPLLFMPITSDYATAMVLTLPVSFTVDIQSPRFYNVNDGKLQINQLDSTGYTSLELFDVLCKKFGIIYVIILPQPELNIVHQYNLSDIEFLELVDRLFLSKGYTYLTDAESGVFVIYPEKNSEDDKPLLEMLKSTNRDPMFIKPDFTAAQEMINEYFKRRYPTISLSIDSKLNLSAIPFTLRYPWSDNTTSLMLIDALARKVNQSVIIEKKEGKYIAKYSPQFIGEKPALFIMTSQNSK